MHDHRTVAHELWLRGKPIITIWHYDPQVDGDEDSCGWTWPKLTERELAFARSLITDKYDNLRHWFEGNAQDESEMIWRMTQIFRNYKWLVRPWWKHPRWHFWHWHFQVHPIQNFKRWVFSRCEYCGGYFSWGYAPLSRQWEGTGPLWFRSEEGIFHHECYSPWLKLRDDSAAEQEYSFQCLEYHP